MSPDTLEDFVGQEHILGQGKLLYRMIKADRISSIIFYGPPGTGKTALASVIAKTTKSNFEKINAVMAGVADIRRVAEAAESNQNKLINPSGHTVLFIDEIHRFNKSQQDALLPYVEKGSIILIGATTENPFFEVNKALISRSSVFMFKPLTVPDVEKIIHNALANKDKGLGNYKIDIDNKVIKYLATISGGDARIALNGLELAVITSKAKKDGRLVIDMKTIEDSTQKRALAFDKSAEEHYDNISAFIKSMRGSDPDAAVFYLARALYAGEDVEFLARRIVICASEDVGMGNPNALLIATAAAQAVKMIGMPESRIILAQAAITVATSPKSNRSYMAISKAMDDIENKSTGSVPMHLRNPVTKGMKDLGYGEDYKYAHSYKGGYVEQQFLPDEMVGTIYYDPSDIGYEAKVKEWMEKLKAASSDELTDD
jgi:putative ATPase